MDDEPKMHAEIFALCDAATEQGGRLNMLGVFDQLRVALPFVLPHSAIVLRMRINEVGPGAKHLNMVFKNPQGEGFIPELNTEINLPEQSPPGGRVVNMILNLQGLKFVEEGIYTLTLRLDGHIIGQNLLRVLDETPKEPNPLA